MVPSEPEASPGQGKNRRDLSEAAKAQSKGPPVYEPWLGNCLGWLPVGANYHEWRDEWERKYPFFVKVFCVESWLPKAPQSLPEAPPGNQKPVDLFFVGEQCGPPNHEVTKTPNLKQANIWDYIFLFAFFQRRWMIHYGAGVFSSRTGFSCRRRFGVPTTLIPSSVHPFSSFCSRSRLPAPHWISRWCCMHGACMFSLWPTRCLWIGYRSLPTSVSVKILHLFEVLWPLPDRFPDLVTTLISEAAVFFFVTPGEQLSAKGLHNRTFEINLGSMTVMNSFFSKRKPLRNDVLVSFFPPSSHFLWKIRGLTPGNQILLHLLSFWVCSFLDDIFPSTIPYLAEVSSHTTNHPTRAV